jgi:prepilin-type N-terminal cleavage/methylation domain-containing protein
VPKLLELPGQITLRKSRRAGPSFSTLTLSLAPTYDEVACGLASVTFPTTEPPFFGVTRDEGRRAQPPRWGNGARKAFAVDPPSDRPPHRKKGFMFSRRMRGFSLIEMMVVVALIMIVMGFSIMAIQPALRQNDVTEAFNQTLMALRQARDFSVAQRQIYFVTLSNAAVPNSITITQGSTGTVTATYFLPSDVIYFAYPGLPTSPTVYPMTPDGFGIGTTAIDFDQGVAGGVKNVIYFYPDGSAEDAIGNVNNGVVYMALAGNTGFVSSSRAITLWGATGRLRGWHIYSNLGQWYWRQQ